MKKYKYIMIEQTKIVTADKPHYQILNKKTGYWLGEIFYDAQWKQYVSRRDNLCIFSVSCDRDIIDFIEHHAGKE